MEWLSQSIDTTVELHTECADKESHTGMTHWKHKAVARPAKEKYLLKNSKYKTQRPKTTTKSASHKPRGKKDIKQSSYKRKKTLKNTHKKEKEKKEWEDEHIHDTQQN